MKLIDSGAAAANDASTASGVTACALTPEVKYILGIDVGSTVIRCHVYDKAAVLKGFSSKQVRIVRSSGKKARHNEVPLTHRVLGIALCYCLRVQQVPRGPNPKIVSTQDSDS